VQRLSMFYATCSTAALRAMVRATAYVAARQQGQGLVEYGLILVLIMVVCVGILTLLGRTVSDVWYTKLVPAFT
jgi:pilus assembly protein Flp/PilA